MGRLTTLKPRIQTLGASGPKARGWSETRRTSSSERGYGWEWQKKRKVILARDCGLCQTCKRLGRYTLTNIVDHIVGKEDWKATHDGRLDGCDDESNLEAICADHHKLKTAAESKRARDRASAVLGPARR